MSISAVNNTTAFSVYTNFSDSAVKLQKSMGRLATGTKATMDDGAAVAISERMRSQARSTAMARTNTENGISLLQTADSWMQRMNDMLARMHELAIEASDATKTASDRDNIQAEFGQLQSEIGRIADSAAKYNGVTLFDSTYASGVNTQVGADSGQTVALTLVDLTTGASTDIDGSGGSVTWGDILSSGTTSVTASASTAISNLSTAIDFVSKQRATLGGQQSRLENTRSGLLTYEDNLRAAESKIRDVDMARESSEMATTQILNQVGNAMLAQANQLPQSVLQLVG